MADKAFERVHGWFVQAVEAAVQAVPDAPGPNPAAGRNALRQVLWSLADPVNRAVAPPPADAAAFNQPAIAGQSLAIAALVAGEALVAIDPLKKLLDALDNGAIGAAQEAIATLIDQIKRAADGARLYPSAFGIGKLLLTVSGDTGQPPALGNALKAQKLAEVFAGTQAGRQAAHTAMGVNTLLLGAVLDTAFAANPEATLKDWAGFTGDTVLGAGQQVLMGFVPGVRDADSARIDIQGFDPLRGLRVAFSGGIDVKRNDGPTREVVLKASAQGAAELRWDAPGPRLMASNGPADSLGLTLDIALKKKSGNQGAISIPAPEGNPVVRLQLDELGAGLTLAKPPGGSQLAPALTLRAKNGKLVVRITDALLSQVMGPEISVDFSVEALADAAGGFRLKDGTSLRVNLPIQALPTGPFKLQLITLAVEPKDGFARIETELSISAGVDLGPFKASVERLGARLTLTTANGAVALAFKPPTGIGLSLDAGVIKGGGFLSLDPELGEYKGALELKIAAIGVKALGMLNTKRPPGNNWSLLLLIFGNFPPIQLSWGFTLTGVGGLIGVQHTADATAMAQQLGAGGLDAVLFPQDVANNAPQIFETLKTLFPFKPGGFVIGPMLEVGWGTPSLVSLRLGILIEASQIAILGQLVIQVPPLVDKSCAILRLQIDFVGVIVFDPFKIAFDGKLRDSRVAFITLTGQFAFRAAFGDKPTFLLSAGGFHPRFVDIPPDIPMPFDRIGAGFSIGIVGVSVAGYFAVTSATVQAGFELKAWGDVGVASFDAGLGFDAICYLQPKFYFEVDFRAWAHAQAFGIGFGISMSGLLAGPGRWRIRGVGEVDLGFFGSVEVEFDEAFGDDTDTPLVEVNAFDLLLAEVKRRDNWSVALPGNGETLITVQQRPGEKEPVAHPLAALVFTQRKLPLRRQLAKVGEAVVKGDATLDIGGLTFNDALVPGVRRQVQREHFAASQFFKISDDDKLSAPSFELMDAGETLGADDCEFDPAALVSAPVDWESRDLSPAPASREWLLNGSVLGLVAEAHAYARNPDRAGWMLATGAVARSSLRAAERLRPADARPMAVHDQAPTVLASKATASALAAGGAAATVHAGAWAARQALAAGAGAVAAAELQVIELHELA
jgi:hypothetical protein